MTKLAYNNVKYTNTGYTSFKLNYRYHLRVFYKENVDPCSSFKIADKLTKKLRNLIVACRKNLQYTQKIQKRAHNKETKPKSYAFGKKV